MSTRTNPAYAHIAYRRSIINELVVTLRDSYMALSGSEPTKTIVCPEVFSEDAAVPTEAIQNIIEDLEQEAENLRLELGKFVFTKQEARSGIFSGKKSKKARRQGKGQVQ